VSHKNSVTFIALTMLDVLKTYVTLITNMYHENLVSVC